MLALKLIYYRIRKKEGLISLALLLLLAIPGFSQDRVFLVNDSLCVGKILGKKNGVFSIQMPDDQSVFKVHKKDVSLVLYQNGKYNIINTNYRPIIGKAARNMEAEIWKGIPKNQIKVNVFMLIFAQTAEVTLHRRLSEFWAVEIPMSLGWGWQDAESGRYDLRKKRAIGISALFFPVHKPSAPVEFYLGPTIEFGNTSYSELYANNFGNVTLTNLIYDNSSSRTLNPYNSDYINYALRIGTSFNFSNWTALAIEIAPAGRQYNGDSLPQALSFGFNIGYTVKF